jgi:ferredoxin
MALMITNECIICGACGPECPSDAIAAGNLTYEINPELCTECVGFYYEPRCRSVCPVPESLVLNPDFQETRGELLRKKLIMDHNKFFIL